MNKINYQEQLDNEQFEQLNEEENITEEVNILKNESYTPPEKEYIIYTAGLFDGEGCAKINFTNTKYGQYGLEASITNTNTEISEWLKNKWKFGTINITHRSCANLINNTLMKECYYWRTFGKTSLIFLKCIYPYLIIKKSDVFIAMAFQDYKNYIQSQYKYTRPEEAYIIQKKLKDLLMEYRQEDFELVKEKISEIFN